MKKQKINEKKNTEYVERTERITAAVSSNDEIENLPLASHTPIIKSDIEKNFVKKLNWTLLPLVLAIISMQASDKAILSKASAMGMLTEANTSQSQYSLLGSIFYAGYITFQVPNSYLIQHLPTSKYLGVLIMLWGMVTIGTAFCENYNQLVVCRVLLGLFEAPTYPCLFILFSSLYRRQEQSACLGFLWMCNSLGIIFASIVTVAIIKTLDGANGVSLWRWNYIIFGIMTIVIVDHPHSKLLKLNEEEKIIVEERTQDNAVVKEKRIKVHHYWEALCEPRLYLITMGTIACTLPSGGIVIFTTPIIKSFGFDLVESIFINIPNATILILFISLAVYLHRKTGKLFLSITACSLISMIGCILLIVLPHTGIKLVGYFFVWANNASYVFILTLVSSNVSGYSKKVFYNGAVVIGYTLGNFFGPLLILEHEAPTYHTSMIVFAVSNLVVIICVLLSIYLMFRVNKQRLLTGVVKTDAYLDLTDHEDKNFIYKL
ncbi:unnamed protein product [Cunninghamella blakesleeana]